VVARGLLGIYWVVATVDYLLAQVKQYSGKIYGPFARFLIYPWQKSFFSLSL